MLNKFEVGKTYRYTNESSMYSSIYELTVDSIHDNTIEGKECYYGVLNGERLKSYEIAVCSKIRKAKNKDYQVTTDLPVVFNSIDEVK